MGIQDVVGCLVFVSIPRPVLWIAQVDDEGSTIGVGPGDLSAEGFLLVPWKPQN
jgi:hypothetical protein